jgi:hypothetical protein
MDPLAEFTPATFEGRLGDRFSLPASGVDLVLDVVDVKKGPLAGPRPGGAFSLLFSAPGPDMLPQAIHEVSHAGLGAFPLFLVPVARTADGFQYEAAFN